jgi:hypothetical protein
MKPPGLVALLFGLLASISASAQTPAPAKYRVCMDVGHQQRFWRDPANMSGMDANMIERVKYMTGELVKTTTSVNASLSYLKKEVIPKDLEHGGKIIVMGDGMVSLYMTSWEGVQDYQCQEFMQDVFRWLLK